MKNETKEKFLEFCKKEHFDISNETSKQREAVFSDEKYVIPAGAGSGKTTVLTYRFLRLIMDEDIGPIHSDELLTMTFTKDLQSIESCRELWTDRQRRDR